MNFVLAEEPDAGKGPLISRDVMEGRGLISLSTSHAVGPCSTPDVEAAPSRPTWTGGAATTQCGVLESDFGWAQLAMSDASQQITFLTSIRYGVTPRFDIRWGLPGKVMQRGGGYKRSSGITDQSFSGMFRFHEQGRKMPAMALGYGVKIPSANPAKGFGTGWVDHQLTFVASRDLLRAHLDFNFAGILAGGQGGHDSAMQMGLALAMPLSRKWTGILDSYGGSQPGTEDRFGAELIGITWNARPWLVFDAAYALSYTASSPRRQLAFGMTYSRRAGTGGVLAWRRNNLHP